MERRKGRKEDRKQESLIPRSAAARRGRLGGAKSSVPEIVLCS